MFYFGATQQKLRIPHGMDQNVSNMVKHEEDEEEQPPLQVGFAVEARPQNIDELYYAAEITAVRVSDTGAEITASYVVEYEDGTVEEDLPREALLYPQSRKEIFNDGVVRVVEGHACLNNQPVKVCKSLHTRILLICLEVGEVDVVCREPTSHSICCACGWCRPASV